MSAIERCRTVALGDHVARAARAARNTVIAYNSCRNRIARSARARRRREWLEEREAERLFGLATSSGMPLIDVVVDKLGIRNYLHAITSAADLPYGKPHPQVYINCAEQLNSHPRECICFEDSFNGMIAVKAAVMKCVVVPAAHESQHIKFNAADLKLSSLQNFNELLLHTL